MSNKSVRFYIKSRNWRRLDEWLPDVTGGVSPGQCNASTAPCPSSSIVFTFCRSVGKRSAANQFTALSPMMSTTNRVHSDVSSSAATPAKRSRFDNDGSGKLSDRVAELEEDWSDLNNQVSELGRQLEDKNLELSSSSKCVEALTSSLNVERAKCEDLQTKLVEANLKSSSLEAANDELNEQVRQASENNLELQNSLEASNRLIAELTATNVNLQSDLDKQSIFAEEINSKLIASSDVISELNENLETLDKDVTEYKKRIDNMSQRNSEFKLLVSDRDSLAGQVNRLKKANTHYKNQRDQLRTLLAKVTQTPIVTNDAPTVTSSNVQLVNPGRDPRVARPAPSFNIIRELRSKRTITAQMFCAAKHLEFEKYYPKG